MHDMVPQLRRKLLALYFTAVPLCCVCADEDKETVKAREGATVTLNTKETRGHNKIQIVWMFGPENPNMRIANVKQQEVRTDYDELFRGRLRLDSQTGALTITPLRVSDSGLYMRTSIGTSVSSQTFNVIVFSSVCPPSIKVSDWINASCGSVTVECSVENSRELILSWFRGRDRLKKTSSADLSSKLSLALEIDSKDGDNYSCVAENPVEEKATQLHANDTCLKDGETGSWCQTEATVRLAVSAVVGMALIVLVADHIRLRR
ncbi:CD48 antigen-like [Pempheris klunzingeri]|uniref:CD48 antigen-like n=1 Tax=Pempheris klunzingeri TaxID=3127111 RepID=UPI00397FF32B